MGLGDLIQKVHGTDSLSAMLDQFLVQEEAKPSTRAFGWHPSDFVGMCPRQHVLSVLRKYKRASIEPSLRRIFDVGSAMHAWYQNNYFAQMHILWGKWKCLRCDGISWGLLPGEKNCSHCGRSARWEYKEVPIKAPLPGNFQKQIVGRSDGIIQISGKWYLLEIKTINEYGFTWMKNAKDAHRAQVQVYAELIRQDFVDLSEVLKATVVIPEISGILIFYINKNNSLEKIWPLEFDPEFAQAELKRPYLAEMAFRNREFPERRPECKNMLRNPAKKCPMVSYCFGGKSFDQLES